MSVQTQCSLSEYDYLFKIVLKGASGAGKTSFLTRYADGVFSDDFISTIDFRVRTIEIPNVGVVKLQIWDPPAIQRNRAMSLAYYRGAHGIFVLFDCTDREGSLRHINETFDEIEVHARPGIPKMLVAAKTDLVNRREITSQEGKDLADRLHVPYIETSSKLDVNINEAMNIMVNNIVDIVVAPDRPDYLPHSLTSTQSDSGLKVSRCNIM